MSQAGLTADEITRRGQEIYDRQIRDRVKPQHIGKFLVVDIDTGDYEIDTDSLAASDRVLARHPNGTLYYVRIGYPVAHRLGGMFTVSKYMS
jgi:hypothetical protein